MEVVRNGQSSGRPAHEGSAELLTYGASNLGLFTVVVRLELEFVSLTYTVFDAELAFHQ